MAGGYLDGDKGAGLRLYAHAQRFDLLLKGPVMKIFHYPDDLTLPAELAETPAHGLLGGVVTEHFRSCFIDQHGLGGIGLKIPRESPAGHHFYLVLVDIIPVYKIGIQVSDLQVALVIFYL